MVEAVYVPVYPHISAFLQQLTGWFSFSLCEWLLYGIIVVTISTLILLLVRMIRKQKSWRALISYLLLLILLSGIVLDLFYVTWGINYFRIPLESRLTLDVHPRQAEELEILSRSLAQKAVSLRTQVTEDPEGVFTADRKTLNRLPQAYASLAGIQPAFSGPVSRVKSVTLSRRMSVSNISGIYIGLTAEANLNMDQPDLFLFCDGAHELGHQLGNASENEAELTGILACLCSEEVALQYSGTMKALLRCMNALYSADHDRFLAVYDTYSDGMKRDFAAYNRYWDAFSGPAAEFHDNMNDLYLKHNSVSSGIRSYGESVDLLLAIVETDWGKSILFGGSCS